MSTMCKVLKISIFLINSYLKYVAKVGGGAWMCIYAFCSRP